ncbi:MAG: hypothetical protein M1839_001664 [Geoglossum umbratile]|nr:MAG: hypothetical protein M1839_001664 [Geoglossum umbratile]
MEQLRTIEANGNWVIHGWTDREPQSASIRAGQSLGQAIRQQLGGRDHPIPVSPSDRPPGSPSDASMRDAYSIRAEDRDPPLARPSRSEGSRVQGTFGVVIHEGISKRVAGAFKVGRGHSLLLKYRSQNPDYPELAAYSLVPAGDFRRAYNEYIASGGVVFEKAKVDDLVPSDWDTVTILGVASHRQNLGTVSDERGNLYQEQPINRAITRVLAVYESRPDVPDGWYIQSDLITKFGTSIVSDVQGHVNKTGQYRPIHPSPESIALRRRPRRVVAMSSNATPQQPTRRAPVHTYQPIPPTNLPTNPPTNLPTHPPTNLPTSPPTSPLGTNPILTDPLTDEEVLVILERRAEAIRTRISRQNRGQAPSESTL